MTFRAGILSSTLLLAVCGGGANASSYPWPQAKYPQVRVEVVDLTGEALPGATIRYWESGNPSRFKVAVSMADGLATFEINADRQYDIEVSLEGCIPITLHGVNRPAGTNRDRELHRNRHLTVVLNPTTDEVIH